jgi:hypothetical protein
MIVLEAFFSRAYANWAVATYLAGTVLVVVILVKNNAHRWLKANLVYCVVAMLAFYVSDFGAMHNLIKFSYYPPAYRELFGWENAGKKINLLKQRYPQANFVMDDREIWAKGAYFGKLPVNKIYIWDNYDAMVPEVFTSWNKAKHQDFVWLSFSKYMRYDLLNSFRKNHALQTITFDQSQDHRKIYVYYLKDFQGRV